MKKKDILELKKRLKKDDCTFTRMSGCYVNGEKKILLKFSENFLNLEEDEFFKYLEIAKKVLSGTVGTNILQLEFPFEEEAVGRRQNRLMELRNSKLKNEELLDEFYENVIGNYEIEGNFLILLFHDVYDVITKTKDNQKLDESEEVFEYIMCAVCPVTLSKAGLSYHSEDNAIKARERDWVVGTPSNGFIFPAFSERSADIHSLIYYTKNAKDTHTEFMEDALGCVPKQTAAQKKEAFNNIIYNAVEGNDEKSENLSLDIQDTLDAVINEHFIVNGNDAEPMLLSKDNISNILSESGVPQDVSDKITASFEEEFGETPPTAEDLLDSKLLTVNEQRKKEKRLENEVKTLKTKLEISEQKAAEAAAEKNNIPEVPNDSEINSDSSENGVNSDVYSSDNNDNESGINENKESSETLHEETALDNENSASASIKLSTEINDENSDSSYDIVLKVKPQKIGKIQTTIVNGKSCLVIPVETAGETSVLVKDN